MSKSRRLQVSVPGQLEEKIALYAESLGVSVTEAARHLLLRGLEQVQVIMTARDSAAALREMTQVFDRQMSDFESETDHPPLVEGLVTPPQAAKNGHTKKQQGCKVTSISKG